MLLSEVGAIVQSADAATKQGHVGGIVADKRRSYCFKRAVACSRGISPASIRPETKGLARSRHSTAAVRCKLGSSVAMLAPNHVNPMASLSGRTCWHGRRGPPRRGSGNR
jgi:hypothetical protein